MFKLKYFFLLFFISITVHLSYLYFAHKILPQYLFHKIFVTITIKKITENSPQKIRLLARINKVCFQQDCSAIHKFVVLNVYHSYKSFKEGEQWQCYIKLKPWHGYANPGGFNSELWAYLHGISAKGYIYTKNPMHRLNAPNKLSLANIRNKIRQNIVNYTKHDQVTRTIIFALVLGDKSEMSHDLRQLLQETGTSHLLAISGLHIGLVSSFAYFLLYWVWRIIPQMCLWLPARKAAAIFALSIALMYSLISGMAPPALRALLMVLLIFYAVFIHCNVKATTIFFLTLLLSLILRPLSIFNISFWLSYLAIFFIIYTLSGRYQPNRFMNYWKMQLSITLGLMPILFFYFQQSSTIGAITNLLAIPLVSFFILPISFIAGVFPLGHFSYYFFYIDNALIHLLLLWLQVCEQHLFKVLHLATNEIWVTILGFIGCLLLFSPRQLRLNLLSVIYFLPLLYFQPTHVKMNNFILSVIDVGQGSSLLIQTKNHNLLYDLGPIFISGGSATQSAVMPYLNGQKIKKIDRLVISHQDSDHVGDIHAFLRRYPKTSILTSAIKKLGALPNVSPCIAGQKWHWDGVTFKVLFPLTQPYLGNNHESCVLLVKNHQHRLLVTGDLANKDERLLLKHYKEKLKADVLVLSHHGSKHSSSQQFLTKVAPNYAIVSAGFANKFHFPNQAVLQRCQSLGIKVLRTDQCGLIQGLFSQDSVLNFACYRYNYWKF